MVKNIFVTQNVTSSGKVAEDDYSCGLYQLRFFLNGEQKTVTIDDYVPFVRDKMISSTAMNVNSEVQWLALVEKAWAKVCGSYEKTRGIHTLEVLKYLTNTSTVMLHHDLKEPDEIWRCITE